MEGLGCGGCGGCGGGGGGPAQSDSCPHSDGTRRKKERFPSCTSGVWATQPASESLPVQHHPPPPSHPNPHLPSLPLPASLLFVQPGRITCGRGRDRRPKPHWTKLLSPATHIPPPPPRSDKTGGLRIKADRPKLHLNCAKQGSRKRTRDFDWLLGTLPPPPAPPLPLFLPGTPELSEACF